MHKSSQSLGAARKKLSLRVGKHLGAVSGEGRGEEKAVVVVLAFFCGVPTVSTRGFPSSVSRQSPLNRRRRSFCRKQHERPFHTCANDFEEKTHPLIFQSGCAHVNHLSARLRERAAARGAASGSLNALDPRPIKSHRRPLLLRAQSDNFLSVVARPMFLRAGKSRSLCSTEAVINQL